MKIELWYLIGGVHKWFCRRCSFFVAVVIRRYMRSIRSIPIELELFNDLMDDRQ